MLEQKHMECASNNEMFQTRERKNIKHDSNCQGMKSLVEASK